MPIKPDVFLRLNPFSAELVVRGQHYDIMMDNDVILDRYIERTCSEKVAESLGLKMKCENTIVAKWPCRLKKNPTRREFEMVYWSGHNGSERYVEWYRNECLDGEVKMAN